MAYDTATLIANYLQAVGTIGAVVLALFLQVYLVHARRPKFYFTLSLDPNDEDIIVADRNDDFCACWVRAKVWVERRKNPAKNVEVIVQKVWRPTVTDINPSAAGAMLRWAELESERVNIPSGTWRRIDLLQCWSKKDGGGLPTLWPALHKTKGLYPPGRRYRLEEAGAYLVELVVVADDADPSYWHLAFEYAPMSITSAADLRAQLRNVTLKKPRKAISGSLDTSCVPKPV